MLGRYAGPSFQLTSTVFSHVHVCVFSASTTQTSLCPCCSRSSLPAVHQDVARHQNHVAANKLLFLYLFAAGARFLRRASINCQVLHLVLNGSLILKGHIDCCFFTPTAPPPQCVCVCVFGVVNRSAVPAACRRDACPRSINQPIDPPTRTEGQPGCYVEGSSFRPAFIRRIT